MLVSYIVDQRSRDTTHQGAYNDKLISETQEQPCRNTYIARAIRFLT